ncbi:hypothetical protein HMPREF3157_09425 [Dermabacter sp. HMSC06F07]|nr:hypothetical protein HMPREF3157_09425 [Dermabacter sp. HMSC06F07]
MGAVLGILVSERRTGRRPIPGGTSMNAIVTTIQGNATADATIFKFDGGGCRTSVTVAVNDRYYDVQAKEWKERKPEYVRVQVRRESLANNVVLSVKRGQPLLCTGRLVTQTWEDRDGNTRTELLMHADHVAIDLTYGTAQYAKSAPSWVDENTGEVRTTSPDAEDEAAEAGENETVHARLESHAGVEGELSESDLEALTEVEEPSYA